MAVSTNFISFDVHFIPGNIANIIIIIIIYFHFPEIKYNKTHVGREFDISAFIDLIIIFFYAVSCLAMTTSDVLKICPVPFSFVTLKLDFG